MREWKTNWYLRYYTDTWLSCWPLGSRYLLFETLDSNLYHDCLHFLFLLTDIYPAVQLTQPDTILQKVLLFCQALRSGHLIGCCLVKTGLLLHQVPILGPISFGQGTMATGYKTGLLIHRNHRHFSLKG